MKIFITEFAKQNLKDIFEYTLQNHGSKQADKYILKIISSFESLKTHPKKGNLRKEIFDLRTYLIESHTVFYKLEKSKITISAVLHKKMIPENHLH